MGRWITVFEIKVEAEDIAIPIEGSSDVGDSLHDLCSVYTVAISYVSCVHGCFRPYNVFG